MLSKLLHGGFSIPLCKLVVFLRKGAIEELSEGDSNVPLGFSFRRGIGNLPLLSNTQAQEGGVKPGRQVRAQADFLPMVGGC